MEAQELDKENEIVIDCEDDRKPAALPSPLQRKRANEEKSTGEHLKQNETAKRFVIEPKEESKPKPLISKAAALNKRNPVSAMDSEDDSGVDLGGARFNSAKKKEPSNSLQRKHHHTDNETGNREHKKPRTVCMNQHDKSIHLAANRDAASVGNSSKEGACKLPVPSREKDLSSSEDTDLEFARRLQQQLYEDVGQTTQSPRAKTPSPSAEQDYDFQLAMSLQQQEYEPPNQADSKKGSDEMDNSDFGKSITGVKKILELLENTKRKHQHCAINFNAVSSDDMVFLAKNLLETQATFLGKGINAYVDIGYHYTNSRNLNSIRTNGLMTKNERDSQGVTSDRFNGATYGDGVYTANDPMTFANYGDTGLIVGRLLGSVKNCRETTGDENTVLVPHNGMIVLRTSAQCLPMIKYDTTLVTSEEGHALIIELQKSLQEILDEVFNPGLTAPNVRTAGVNGFILLNALQYIAPASLPVNAHDSPIGKSPSGSMTVTVNTYSKCGGYPNCNMIEIVYSILSGIQKTYHEDPGQPHQGKNVIAYLPDNMDGQNLLKRLKFAFMHGLTFTVGTNQCSFSSIHHKTYPNGGANGFPDPNYFANCNGELDSANVPAAHMLDADGKKLNSSSPPPPSAPRALQYFAPASISVNPNHSNTFCGPPSSCNFQDDCPICLDSLKGPQYCFALKVCNHVFHKGCILQACSKFGSKCPTCRKSIGPPIGKSPSGSMTANVNTFSKCGGYPFCNTIEIVYNILSGIQKVYHEHPGQPHQGKHAIAYLPNNTEGQSLLKRLKFAFMHGLTFTVGTSVTTGATNQCTWSSIHHKTSPNGGVHGFPDTNFFVNCNGELDDRDVPAAHELDVNGKKLNI